MLLYLDNIQTVCCCCRYVGEAEKRIEQLFVDARREAPSLILIDELDSLCPRRNHAQNDIERRVTAALCSQIDTLVCFIRQLLKFVQSHICISSVSISTFFICHITSPYFHYLLFKVSKLSSCYCSCAHCIGHGNGS